MYRILYDCDNTIGIEGRDVDDGLTLLYLLGREDVDLLGVTTTHGNGTIEEVYDNTKRMINELGLKNVQVYKGSYPLGSRASEAADFLIRTALENRGELVVLATGSLTNLYGAYLKDSKFFSYLKEVVIMGGILHPLMILGKKVDELNFSCDAEAAYAVLTSGVKLTVLNGHTSLEALFGEKEIQFLKDNSTNKIMRFIKKEIEPWYSKMYEDFGMKGFCNWDAAAAIYITNPELFLEDTKILNPSVEELRSGYMRTADKESEGNMVNMPKAIKNIEVFNQMLINSWKNIK